MVYGKQRGCREGALYCPCNSVVNAGGRGVHKDVRFVHKSLEVNEYLAKANLQLECVCVFAPRIDKVSAVELEDIEPDDAEVPRAAARHPVVLALGN